MPARTPALLVLAALAALALASCAESPVDTPDADQLLASDAAHDVTDSGPVEDSDAGAAPDDAGEPPPDADAGPDPVDAGEEPVDAGFTPAPAALCPVRTMDAVFSGEFPPNPYGANVVDMADSCTASRHDAILVLGCPSQADGTAAPCQIARVEIALVLKSQGFGDQFIVSGDAVHNQWVEADTLAAQLVSRGVPASDIHKETRARHTDENLYFSTKLMESKGWVSAIVVSQDPGQLIMTATCDSNCCVDLGRLTVLDFPFGQGTKRLGHYVRYPWAAEVSDAECAQVEKPLKLMCQNLSSRLACADDLQVGP